MEGKVKQNYKFAIATADHASDTAPIVLVGSICENIKKAAELGYDAIEIHLRENSDIDYEQILKTLQSNKVRISAVVTGRLAVQENITLTDVAPENIEKIIRGLKQYADIAQRFNADMIIGWIRGQILDNQSKDEYEQILAKNLKVITQYADKKKVKVHIEAINRYELNSLTNAVDTLAFIEKYAIDNAYVHLDTFHMNIEDADMEKAILMCGDKLGYMHFADSNRQYPGAGHIDFEKIMISLKKIKYHGYFSVECLRIPSYQRAASLAIANMSRIMDDVEYGNDTI
jgi:sugar phosphate isomerase/epimerase